MGGFGRRNGGCATALALFCLAACETAEPPAPPEPETGGADRFRGLLWRVVSGEEPPDLHGLLAGGFNAIVLAVSDNTTAEALDLMAPYLNRREFSVYLWFDVGRNPSLAERRPDWVAGMGSHDDWRARFPNGPHPGEKERIGIHPWVSIWYRDVLADRQAAIERFVRGRKGLRGVFLNQIQGAPSACGCANDQCRWTVDYRMPGGPEKVDGVPAALLLAGLKRSMPGLEWIPVCTTECEEVDQAKGGTGYCGTVQCYSGLCWKESTREMEAVAREASGSIALLLTEKSFRRELPVFKAAGGWPAFALRHFETIPPKYGRSPIPSRRFIAVLDARGPEGRSLGEAEERALRDGAEKAGAGGVLLVRTPIDEGWEPRIIPRAASAKSEPLTK